MDDFLQQGIIAYRAGNRDEARKLFAAAIKQNQNDERVWGWMYNVANNDQERKYCLQQVLRINPQNEKAKSKLNDFMELESPHEKPVSVQPVQSEKDKLSKPVSSANSKKSAALKTVPSTKSKKRNLIIGCFALLAVILLCVFLLVIIGNSQPETPDEYVAEYGGVRNEYVEILELNDCELLQEKFDISSENNARQTTGTPLFKMTLGYMKAADERMKEIGCYK